MSSAPPTAKTRLLALLGDPVSHSFSPLLHNTILRVLGLDAVYVALRCAPADCAALLAGIARSGGAGNVTIPHKETAARAIEQPSAAVVRTGACNSFWFENGRVCGDNTDVVGFVRAVQFAFGELAGARVLLLGAGGAARAVLLGLETLSVAQVHVQARSPGRVAQLAPILAGSRTQFEIGTAEPSSFDMIVNATPLGLHEGDPFPWPLAQLAPNTRIFDLVYRAGETGWVRAARAAGFPSADGQEMLVQQAAASFLRWWQRDPPIEQMRLALAAATS